MEIEKLDQEARKIARDYKKLEQQLLGVVVQIDKLKIFYKLGFSSLFVYLTRALELSPAIAYAFINVARKSHEIPFLKEQVEAGKISIYKAQRITPVLTPQNYKTWLKLAASKTHRELEREVTIASPQNAIAESRYVPTLAITEEKITIKRDLPRIELQLGVSEALMLKLRRAQDIESQRNKKNLNLEQTLEEVLCLYLEKRDPLKKAKRQDAKGKLLTDQNQTCRSVDKNSAHAKNNNPTIHSASPTKEERAKSQSQELERNQRIAPHKRASRALPARLKHQLQIRDDGQCTYVDSLGRRCLSRRFLEAHHIRPVSLGGENTLENLTLLCSGHHKVVHR